MIARLFIALVLALAVLSSEVCCDGWWPIGLGSSELLLGGPVWWWCVMCSRRRRSENDGSIVKRIRREKLLCRGIIWIGYVCSHVSPCSFLSSKTVIVINRDLPRKLLSSSPNWLPPPPNWKLAVPMPRSKRLSVTERTCANFRLPERREPAEERHSRSCNPLPLANEKTNSLPSVSSPLLPQMLTSKHCVYHNIVYRNLEQGCWKIYWCTLSFHLMPISTLLYLPYVSAHAICPFWDGGSIHHRFEATTKNEELSYFSELRCSSDIYVFSS